MNELESIKSVVNMAHHLGMEPMLTKNQEQLLEAEKHLKETILRM